MNRSTKRITARDCISCRAERGTYSIGTRNDIGPFCSGCFQDLYAYFKEHHIGELDRLNDDVLIVLRQVREVQMRRGLQGHLNLFERLSILTEEVGELAQAMNDARWEQGSCNSMKEEAVHVAQVALDFVRCLNHDEWSFV